MINVGKVEVSNTLGDLDEIKTRQLPYAIALSLTETAKQAAVFVRNAYRANPSFVKRNAWIERGISWEQANKRQSRPEAAVLWNRDVMILHETGGTDFPHKGHKYIAVPLAPELKGPRVIPPELRPRFLLGDMGGARLSANVPRQRGAARTYDKRAQRMANLGQGFIFHLRGKVFIASHTGPKRRDRLKFWYLLIPSTHILSNLKMFETVKKTVDVMFPGNLERAMEVAVSGSRFSRKH